MRKTSTIPSVALLILSAASAFASAPVGSHGHSHRHPLAAPAEVDRQLSLLENQVAELERILSRPPAEATPAAREAHLSRVETQVAELEALFRFGKSSGHPESFGDQLTALERRMKKFESDLLSLAKPEPPPPPSTRRRVVLPIRPGGPTRPRKPVARPAPPAAMPSPPPPPPSPSTRRRVVLSNLPDSPPGGPTRPPNPVERPASPLANAPPPAAPAPPNPSARRRVVLPPFRTAPNSAKTTAPAAGKAFCATLRLKSKPRLSEPLAKRGPNLFGLFEYGVAEVTRGGPVASETVRVAHGIRWGGGKTSVMNREIGDEIALDLVPLWWYPSFNQVERIGETSGAGVIYTPRLPR